MDQGIVGYAGRGADVVASGVSYDTKPGRDGSYSREQLWRFMWDIRFEPKWRREAELDHAYYDGDQLSMTTLRRMRDLGVPPIVTNMIAPAIDSVTGWEVLSRNALKVVPETDDSYETATAMNVKFKEALRLTEFNRAVGEQFGAAVKGGLGWLEVGRNPDPFGYPYVVRGVPWREMYFDYRSRERNLSDGRFVARRQWFDFEVLAAHFPKHRRAIGLSMSGNVDAWLNEFEELGDSDLARDLAASLEQERRFTLEEDEWRQQWRGRVALYEILYWVPHRVEVLRLRNGRVVALDRNSELHLEALRRNLAIFGTGVAREWRQAWYCGPERLGDRPLELNRPHYVPVVAYRKDNDGAPYGVCKRMRSPQENLNARNSRMLYDQTSRKYLVDDDAVDDHAQTAEELNKVNSYVVLKAGRQGEVGLQQLPTAENAPILMQLMQQSKEDIYNVTGIFPEFMGRSQGQDQSGVAIDNLAERATQVLGTIVDNYRWARTEAGQLLFGLIREDIAGWDEYEVEADDGQGGARRNVVLNHRAADGRPANDVTFAEMRVALSETPETATYQQQKFQSLVEIVKSMPEEMQAVMMDLVVKASALPDSEEIMDRIRAMTGYGPEPKDPEKRAELAEQQARQQAAQEKLQEIEMMLQEADVATKRARAALDEAKAIKTAGADTEHTEAETGKVLAETEAIPEEQDRKEEETEAKRVEAAARLRLASRPAPETKGGK